MRRSGFLISSSSPLKRRIGMTFAFAHFPCRKGRIFQIHVSRVEPHDSREFCRSSVANGRDDADGLRSITSVGGVWEFLVLALPGSP